MRSVRKRWIPWFGAAVAIVLLTSLLVEVTRNPPRAGRPSEPSPGVPEAVPDPEKGEEQGSETGTKAVRIIRGTVRLEEDDSPVAGASVTAHDRSALSAGAPWLAGEDDDLLDLRLPGPPAAATVSGEDGGFVLHLPREGFWSIRAGKRGVGDAAAVVRTGSRSDLFLEGFAERTYRLVDENDLPVSGARATVHPWEVCCPPRAEAISDEEGYVRLPTGEADVLFIRAEGFARHHVESPLEVAGATIILRPAWSVSGVVTNLEGDPIPGVAVRLGCWWNELTITGKDGRFSFEGIPKETNSHDGERPLVSLNFHHPDYSEAWHDVVPGDPDAGIVLLQPGTTVLTVQVILPPGMEDLEDIRLRAHTPHGANPKVARGPQGSFTLSAVPPGALHLAGEALFPSSVRPYSVCRGEQTLEIMPGGGPRRVQLRLHPIDASIVAVRIQDPEGRPVLGAGVWTDQASGAHMTTGTDGLAVLTLNAPPGTPVTLYAGKWPGSRAHRAGRLSLPSVVSPSQPPPVLTLAPGPLLTIRAVAAAGGPLTAAAPRFLVLQKQRPTGDREAGDHVSADPGDPNRASTRLRPDLGFRVVVRADGYGLRSVHHAAPGDKDLTVEVRLSPEAVLRGRLVTQTGQPMRRAYVQARIVTDHAEPVYAGATEEIAADGGFALGGLVPGRIRITVFDIHRMFHSPVAEIERVLPVSGVTDVGTVVVGVLPRLKGIVRSPDGAGIAAAVVLVKKRGETRWLARAISAPDGTFELATHLRPDHVLTFRKDGWKRREVDLVADAPDRFYSVTLTPER